MQNSIETIGNIAAVVGILLCGLAGLARLTGSFNLMDFDPITIFIGGVGIMVFAVLAKVEALLRR